MMILKNKSAKFAINKIAALVLSLSAGFLLLFIIFLNDDGGVQKGNQVMESTMDKITQLSRGNTPVNRFDIPVSKGFLSTWKGLVADITERREKLKDESDNLKKEYCILPLSTTYFDENNKIELLHSDDGLVVKLTYKDDASQTTSEKYEAVTIDDFNVRLGLLSENDFKSDYFSKIVLQDTTSVDLGSGLGLKKDETGLTFATSIDELSYLFMPLFMFSYDSSDFLSYNAKGSMQGVYKHPRPATVSIIAEHSLHDKPPLLLLMNYSTVIVIAMEKTDSDFYLYRLNLMGHFEHSGLDDSKRGYPFCNERDYALLEPREDKHCSCDVAKNKAMCTSLQLSNCGMTCEWDEKDNTCILTDETKSNVFKVVKEAFTNAINDFKTKHRNCYTTYPLAIQTPSDDELSTLLSGLTLDFKENKIFYKNNKNSVDSLLPYSVSESIVDSKRESQLFSFKNGKTSIEFLGVSKNKLLIAHSGNANLKRNNGFYYQMIMKQGDDSIHWVTQSDLQKEKNAVFCSQEDIYSTGMVSKNSPCKDVSTKNACLLHEESGERCHWYKRESFFPWVFTGCKSDASKKTAPLTDISGDLHETINKIGSFLLQSGNNCYAESPITDNTFEIDGITYTLTLKNLGDSVGIFVHAEGKNAVDFLQTIVKDVTLAQGLRPIPPAENSLISGVYELNEHEMKEGYTYIFRDVDDKRIVFISKTADVKKDDLSDLSVCS